MFAVIKMELSGKTVYPVNFCHKCP